VPRISTFTYRKPDAKDYLRTLIKYLRYKGETQIADLLEGSKCVIQDSTTFSGKRWDAFYTKIYFYVPLSNLEKVNQVIVDKLIAFCDSIMPGDAGLDIMDVEFSPLLESAETMDRSLAQVEDVAASVSQEIMAKIFPGDIRQKGQDMAGVYLYLYCIENSLRLFIETVSKSAFSEQYFDKLTISRSTREKIAERKADAAKKKWLPARGDSDIFYLDFDDLGSITRSNWGLFSPFFPDLNWIAAKIDELSDCRNLVAHNSFLESHQRNLIKVYYTSILLQLNQTLSKS
jgi:hypothetical protein